MTWRATMSSSSSSWPPASLHSLRQLRIVDLEAAFHASTLRPATYRPRVSPAAEQQTEPADDHRLACAGLAGDHGETGMQTDRRVA